MLGIVKEYVIEVIHAAEEPGPSFCPCAAMYVANVMRHDFIGRLWSQPTFGELVAVIKPGPKNALEARGQ
eukprot:1593113-Prorocentrum_lima.AAC.1